MASRAPIKFAVSTHSRLKAAGCPTYDSPYHSCCFNTQPPEGGWVRILNAINVIRSFNTQPPEGGWTDVFVGTFNYCRFNTQPPEGGWFNGSAFCCIMQMFQHTAA